MKAPKFTRALALLLPLLLGPGLLLARYDVNRPAPDSSQANNDGSGKTGRTAVDCLPSTSSAELDINNVRALLHNGGDMWWDLISNPRYEVPKVDDPSQAKHSMFASSLWIGGFDGSGQLRIAAQTYRQGGNDFWPGPLTVDGSASIQEADCQQWDEHFKITKAEIDAFRAEFAAQGSNVNLGKFPNVRDWPGTNPFNDGRFDTDMLAPFVDVNQDGEYDPTAGDFPDIQGDQAIWWVVNDKGNIHTETMGEAIGVEIQMLAFAFATSNAINDMTFYRERVINRSTNVLNETFIGQWVDGDLGFFADDFVGCDTIRGLGFTYNGDNSDDLPQGYGDNPPASGVDFFQGPFSDPDDGLDNDRDGQVDELDSLGRTERIGMSKFIFYNNDFSVRGNPVDASDFYGYLSGFWRNGSPIVDDRSGNGNGFPDQGEQFTQADFMFPDFPNSCGSASCDQTTPPSGQSWDEICAGNDPFDRRFVQSAGPFTLQPGAENEIVVGAVWARDLTGGNTGSVCKLLQADDVAQRLFDANFDLLDGPDAPDLTIEEFDRELVLSWQYTNPASNNFFENYRETDPVLEGTVQDPDFNFEGYIIYQLRDGGVSANDLDDESLARPIAQADIENGVGTIVNREEFRVPGVNEPIIQDQVMVEGDDDGLIHSLRVTEDAFAEGSQGSLVNYREYFFAVVAYAYNDTSSDGQRFIVGNGNFRRVSAIAHKTSFEDFGLVLNSQFGDGIPVERISGLGTGGQFIDVEPAVEDEILANNRADIDYAPGASPIQVEVVNPKQVQDETYRVIITRDSLIETNLRTNDEGVVTDTVDVRADWVMGTWDESSQTFDTVFVSTYTVFRSRGDTAPTPLSGRNQNVPGTGLSVSVEDFKDPGLTQDDVNGFRGATMEFEDETKQWLAGLPDQDNFNSFNWIRSGEACETDGDCVDPNDACVNGLCTASRGPAEDVFEDYTDTRSYVPDNNYDPGAAFENMLGGTWAPYVLSAHTFLGENLDVFGPSLRVNPGAIGPTPQNNGAPLSEMTSLQELPNVDIVITKDPSKWTRCMVLESSPNKQLSSGAYPLAPRWAKSQNLSGENLEDANQQPLDPNGDRLNQAYGFSWFPGYAIDLDRGVRLNMMFAESSWHKKDNGNDMLWNPTSTFDADAVGGRHYLYVLKTPYDSGNGLADFRVKTKFPDDVVTPRRTGFQFFFGSDTVRLDSIHKQIAWTSIPLLTGERFSFQDYSDIPTDVRIKLRVDKSFQPDPTTGAPPTFQFNTGEQAAAMDQRDVAKGSVDSLINIVPNPFFGRSGIGRGSFEISQLDHRVKFTNLPQQAEIKIFTVNGQLVRTFNKNSQSPELEWDLRNQDAVPIASGIYVIHIDAGELGERTLKFLAVMPEIDLNAF